MGKIKNAIQEVEDEINELLESNPEVSLEELIYTFEMNYIFHNSNPYFLDKQVIEEQFKKIKLQLTEY